MLFLRLCLTLSLIILTTACGKDGYAPGMTTGGIAFTGATTTIAGAAGVSANTDGTGTSARFVNPREPYYDGSRTVYICDNGWNVIRTIDTVTKVVTTIAGNTGGIQGTTNAVGTAARFSQPTDLVIVGNYAYITDFANHLIRRMDVTTKDVTTFAGTTSVPGAANGIGTAASFNYPVSIDTDGTNLYVADNGNNRIRKIEISTATVSTLAGSSAGNVDGTGTAARLDGPNGLTYHKSALYFGDQTGAMVKKVTLGGVVTSIAGTSGNSTPVDGIGPDAHFGSSTGIRGSGNYLFITDFGGNAVRVLNLTTNAVTTLSGSLGINGTVDGVGSAARHHSLLGVEIVGASLWVADWGGKIIREIK